MTKQITLEEALRLVSFYHRDDCDWEVRNVRGNVFGNVDGAVWGNVNGGVGGAVNGAVGGAVGGNVGGDVRGTIKGRSWEFVEPPKEKLQRLITESGNQELIDAFNQMENNS